MGVSNSTQNEGNFRVEAYRKQGLSDDDIRQLHRIFVDLGPDQDGLVKASRLKQQYQESMNKQDFDLQIGQMEYIDWDTFFHIMSNDIIEKRQRFGDVQFDSSSSDVGCIFCPYTVNQQQA